MRRRVVVEHIPLSIPDNPRLARNVAHFVRALRAGGLPLGPGTTLSAVRAVETGGLTNRADFREALATAVLTRPEDRAVFDATFRLFWRDPRYLDHMMSLLIPTMRGTQEERAAEAGEMRAAQGLIGDHQREPPPIRENEEAEQEIEIDASATASGEERLRTLDFEQMSAEEARAALRLIARLALPAEPLPTRRQRPAPSGRIDPRATFRAAMRQGGEATRLHRRSRVTRWPDLVALCDISGSMSAYSRPVLHLLHALAGREGRGWADVHAFTFGTRLTNISRHLATKDVDAALAAAGAEAQDWEGGTRIGASLRAFNRDWGRRVLPRGATVLLVTDGLERDDPDLLEAEAARLHRTARRVMWLNPLLRFDGFAPRAAGMRALIRHVDEIRAGHSVAALNALAEALSGPPDPSLLRRLRATV